MRDKTNMEASGRVKKTIWPKRAGGHHVLGTSVEQSNDGVTTLPCCAAVMGLGLVKHDSIGQKPKKLAQGYIFKETSDQLQL